MRHRKKFNHLGRTSSHRKAMLSNMACSLIFHKRIKTTLAKAKALRVYVEPLITKSKLDNTHSRRVVFGHLQNKEAVSELFRDISVKVADRPGGYTRILKLGNRFGDAAEICYIELVDYNENMLGTKTDEGDKKRTRRSRRRKSSGSAAAPKAESAQTSQKDEETVAAAGATTDKAKPAQKVPEPAEDKATAPSEKKASEPIEDKASELAEDVAVDEKEAKEEKSVEEKAAKAVSDSEAKPAETRVSEPAEDKPAEAKASEPAEDKPAEAKASQPAEEKKKESDQDKKAE